MLLGTYAYLAYSCRKQQCEQLINCDLSLNCIFAQNQLVLLPKLIGKSSKTFGI